MGALPIRPAKRLQFARPVTQLQTQQTIQTFQTNSSGRDSSVPLLTMPSQHHAQSQQSLTHTRMSLGTLPASQQIDQDPYAELKHEKPTLGKQPSSFDCRKVIPSQKIKINQMKAPNQNNLNTSSLRAQKKRLNFDHQGMSGYQIASLRLKGCHQSEVNLLTRNNNMNLLKQAQTSQGRLVANSSFASGQDNFGVRIHQTSSWGEEDNNLNSSGHELRQMNDRGVQQRIYKSYQTSLPADCSSSEQQLH